MAFWLYSLGRLRWWCGRVTDSKSVENWTMENFPVLDVLFLAAIALLIIISGGILYLSVIEWRDRRRQSSDKKLNKP